MGAGVDACRQAADDQAAPPGQVPGQTLRHGPPVRGGPPRADNGHGGISKGLRVALDIEDERRIEDLSQIARIPGTVKGQESIRLPADFFQFPAGPVQGDPGDDGLDRGLTQAKALEIGPGRPRRRRPSRSVRGRAGRPRSVRGRQDAGPASRGRGRPRRFFLVDKDVRRARPVSFRTRFLFFSCPWAVHRAAWQQVSILAPAPRKPSYTVSPRLRRVPLPARGPWIDTCCHA